MKKKDIKQLTHIVEQEIKGLYQEFIKTNGNSSLRISNKEFNLWIVKKISEQDGRIIRLETTARILEILLGGLVISLIGGIL